LNLSHSSIPGLKVTVMGLGLHGGGLAAARFFAGRGADVTVTDLRSEDILAPSIDKLRNYQVRYVLGRHDISDFTGADLVIKNPAVREDSPYLQAARQIETDISIFLRFHRGPVAAVTGSKGKSTTASAMHHMLQKSKPRARLGGNITVSPLDFLQEEGISDEPVVLELSSWQLADLRGKHVLSTRVAVITNILKDHQNRYESMDHYVSDKMVLFEDMLPGQNAVFNYDDPVLRQRSALVAADTLYFTNHRLPDGKNGGYLENGRAMRRTAGGETLLFDSILLKGAHNRLNLLAAALGCSCMGVPDADIRAAAASFPGIEHRLEFVRTVRGVSFYNDSAATIPDATVAAARSFDVPVNIIIGGTDKALDFSCLAELEGRVSGIYLLAGNASGKITEILGRSGLRFTGPFSSLAELVSSIMKIAASGEIVVFSPGCTSFEMFLNEFDRGRKFKAIVEELAE